MYANEGVDVLLNMLRVDQRHKFSRARNRNRSTRVPRFKGLFLRII